MTAGNTLSDFRSSMGVNVLDWIYLAIFHSYSCNKLYIYVVGMSYVCRMLRTAHAHAQSLFFWRLNQ